MEKTKQVKVKLSTWKELKLLSIEDEASLDEVIAKLLAAYKGSNNG